MFIVKHKERDFRNNDVWGYISNVSQIAVKEIDPELYIKIYNDIPIKVEEDSCEYMNGVKLSEEITEINKIFSIVAKEIIDEIGGDVHCENLIFDYNENMPIYAILLYIEDSKEFDNILLITDQITYLMNENGKTIERIV